MGRFLLFGYSLIMTIVLAASVIHGSSKTASPTFDQITVHRINVIEPGGTPRMILSDRADFPGAIRRGREEPYKRPYAGMLFYNDEGTETGGLVFGGHKNAKGQLVNSGVSLSFDEYGHPQQIVQLAGIDDIHDHFSGLAINGFKKSGEHVPRLWVGRDASNTASVALMDASGRKRIVLQVLKDGAASIEFLDEHGKVIKQITAGDQ